MGVWFFATFVAQKSFGYVEAVITKLGTMEVFIIIPSVLLVSAVILFAANKKITGLAR